MPQPDTDEISDVLDTFCKECGRYKKNKCDSLPSCKICWYSVKVVGIPRRCGTCEIELTGGARGSGMKRALEEAEKERSERNGSPAGRKRHHGSI